jgi:protein involved in polysaccharide export with SLBB domain
MIPLPGILSMRTMKPLSLVLLVLTSALWHTGCRTGPRFEARQASALTLANLATLATNNQVKAEWLVAPTNLFVLGPGDTIEIEVIGDSPTRGSARVGPDGKIYYNLLPGLDVWGLTLAETKTKLEQELAKYFTQPQVGVTLRGVESKRVWLLGRFGSPGAYPIVTPLTLLEAVAMAGGAGTSQGGASTEELADLRHGFVLRQGELLPVDFYRLIHEGDMSQNIYLQPSDFVYVPSNIAQEIYVLGAVRGPRAVTYRDNMSLTYAIASTGGPAPEAFLSHVAIVRGSLTQPQIAIVDYGAILTGKATDVLLEPRDIVYVPLTPYRHLTRYLNQILNTFVRIVASNAGSTAVSSRGGTVGLSVGVSTPP